MHKEPGEVGEKAASEGSGSRHVFDPHLLSSRQVGGHKAGALVVDVALPLCPRYVQNGPA